MTPRSPDPLLEVRGLVVKAGRSTLLEDLDLAVERGELLALVGPNGGGKTTLLRSILGEIPFTGEILCHFRGTGRIGYVPQRLAIDPTLPLTVRDFLALLWQRRPACWGSSRGLRRKQDELLARLGLAELGRRLLADLSGGEQRRVILAQALHPEPELLLLDEPAAGVDRLAGERMEAAWRELREHGTTVILVSHDFEQIQRVADRAACLNRRLRCAGTPREVLHPDEVLATFGGEGDA